MSQLKTSPISSIHSSSMKRHESTFRIQQRIAVVGAHHVGKSALSIQLTESRFEESYTPTVDDTYQWTTNIDGVPYDVTIVDTDGQDGKTHIPSQYTIGIDGYVLIFSVRNEQSLEAIKYINDRLLDTLSVTKRKGTSEIPRVLVGNQIDEPHQRHVSRSIALKFANEQGIPYIETSASTSSNVQESFNTVLRQIRENLKSSHEPQSTSTQKPSPQQSLDQSNTSGKTSNCSLQ